MQGEQLENIARKAQVASRTLAAASSQLKNDALKAIIVELNNMREEIEAANRKDKMASEKNGLSDALFARLNLEGEKFDSLLQGVNDIEGVEDPVGMVTLARELDNGLDLYRVTCPIGVLCIVFESRPEAAVQIASLAIKSANAVILKGGSEALNSNQAIVRAFRKGLAQVGLPEDAVQLVSSREDVSKLLELDEYIDLVIPRGSNALVKNIMNSTRIPVMGHADGICAIYVDESAKLEETVKLVVDSKTQYPAACNTAETLLIHESLAKKFLPTIGQALSDANVKLHADKESFPLLPSQCTVPATEKDFKTEYVGLEMAVKIVKDVDEAIEHINSHGSGHTDAIITHNGSNAERFLEAVSSANVYHNASTRFADGFRYGFGAEVGVSTNRIHARGPVGLEGLLIYKYRLHGKGQIVAEYGPSKRKFTHSEISLRGKCPRAPKLDSATPSIKLPYLDTSCIVGGLGLLSLGFVVGVFMSRN